MRKAIRTVVGVILVLLGLAALLTPLTPGSWLIPIGLEFLGLRILLENRCRAWAAVRPHSLAARVALRIVSYRPLAKWVRAWSAARPDSRTARLALRIVCGPSEGSAPGQRGRQMDASQTSVSEGDGVARPRETGEMGEARVVAEEGRAAEEAGNDSADANHEPRDRLGLDATPAETGPPSSPSRDRP
jgi:hypothetical protein